MVYEWARGLPFKDICQLTTVDEGLIVRTVTRLDETCREVCQYCLDGCCPPPPPPLCAVCYCVYATSSTPSLGTRVCHDDLHALLAVMRAAGAELSTHLR